MEKILITGASGDIGRAIALEFAKDSDAYIYIHYSTNKDAALETLGLVGAERGSLVQFDLRDKNGIESVLKELDIDILVNNAAVIRDKYLFWMQEDEWQEVIDTNLTGAFRIIKALLPKMIAKKRGSIVNISSISSQKGNIAQANYAASKGGLEALTRTLAKELGRYGIRVNTITPGIIRSKITQELSEDRYKEIIALGRFGEVSEVAEAVYFIAKKGSYITGQNINVCGGFA